MLIHIILFVLKLIGILLLAIFCLAALIICVILFAPLKYKGEFSGRDTIASIKGNLSFSWFLHLISGQLSYENESLSWNIRIAWKKLSWAGEEESPAKSEHTKKKKIPEKSASVEKKETPPESQWSKISGTLKKLYGRAGVIKDFLCDEIHKAAFFKAIKEVKRFLFRIKPRRLEGEVCYGFEDPSVTGKIFGVISMTQTFLGGELNIQPDFEKKRLEGNIIIIGKFCIIYAVIFVLKLIVDKNIRAAYRHIKS